MKTLKNNAMSSSSFSGRNPDSMHSVTPEVFIPHLVCKVHDFSLRICPDHVDVVEWSRSSIRAWQSPMQFTPSKKQYNWLPNAWLPKILFEFCKGWYDLPRTMIDVDTCVDVVTLRSRAASPRLYDQSICHQNKPIRTI